MQKRPTQRDVAREAGVSVATVSLALSGDGRVSSAKRLAVQAAAEKIGYIPHPFYSLLGRSRGSGKAMTDYVPLALLTKNLGDSFYYSRMPNDAKKRGYGLNAAHPAEFLGASGSRKLYNRGIQGIFLGVGAEDYDFRDFVWDRFVVITLDSARTDVEGHELRTAVFDPMFEACLKLKARGFRRIGAVMPVVAKDHPDDRRRLGGFLAANERFPESERLPMLQGDAQSSFLFSSMEQYIRRYRPDVIISLNAGICRAIRAASGLPVVACVLSQPDEVDLCGWKMLDEEKIQYAFDLMDRQIRIGALGIKGIKLTHQIFPQWNEGMSLVSTQS